MNKLLVMVFMALLAATATSQKSFIIGPTIIDPTYRKAQYNLFTTWGNTPLQYQFALSSSINNGQRINRTFTPLDYDPLFAWSMGVANSSAFKKSQGDLLRGNAHCILTVPNHPALRGLKFHVAAIISFPGSYIDASSAFTTTIH